MRLPIDILHLHTFKCAGTTFSWILEKCFPHQVLYVESVDSGSRLDWRRVAVEVDLLPYKALTSHLIDCPPPDCLARLKVSFIREPLRRFRSAFLFTRDVQKLLPAEMSFKDYMLSQSSSIVSNFQTRHLSPQGDEGFASRKGWQLRLDRIDFHRVDLFVGLVERFDESLVVLEQQLAEMGCPLDLSYPQAFNAFSLSADTANGGDDPPQWILNQLEVDQALWQLANCRLDQSINQLSSFASHLADFRARCKRLSDDGAIAQSFRVKPVHQWTYLGRPAADDDCSA